mmetsp:Transcript_785/g.1675  ORF Transcript_785/g.1675 Transcript_785/m.1675 type:complete len:216 (+) Transcript_785:809-1456(+)
MAPRPPLLQFPPGIQHRNGNPPPQIEALAQYPRFFLGIPLGRQESIPDLVDLKVMPLQLLFLRLFRDGRNAPPALGVVFHGENAAARPGVFRIGEDADSSAVARRIVGAAAGVVEGVVSEFGGGGGEKFQISLGHDAAGSSCFVVVVVVVVFIEVVVVRLHAGQEAVDAVGIFDGVGEQALGAAFHFFEGRVGHDVSLRLGLSLGLGLGLGSGSH